MDKQNITEVFLTPNDLALRWNVTPHTLGQWRWKGHGPRYVKLGGCILYRREEIEKFEAYVTQITTADATDPRFLCITVGSTTSKEKEGIVMDP